MNYAGTHHVNLARSRGRNVRNHFFISASARFSRFVSKQVASRARDTALGHEPRGSCNHDQVAPSFTGSDRVNGSGGALCLTALRGAYRRVTQSRICTTVYCLAQTIAWGVRPLRDEKSAEAESLRLLETPIV
jgi:hypothetical protein